MEFLVLTKFVSFTKGTLMTLDVSDGWEQDRQGVSLGTMVPSGSLPLTCSYSSLQDKGLKQHLLPVSFLMGGFHHQ